MQYAWANLKSILIKLFLLKIKKIKVLNTIKKFFYHWLLKVIRNYIKTNFWGIISLESFSNNN